MAAADGHDAAAVADAIRAARAETARPSLICCRTKIGFGAPNKAGQASSHGAALGDDEVALVRAELNWPRPPFEIPPEIYAAYDATAAGKKAEADWRRRFDLYAREFPQMAAEFERRMAGQLPADWAGVSARAVDEIHAAKAGIATRKASQNALEKFGEFLPELIGGSADLTESNLTWHARARDIARHDDGNYIYFGVREFAMAAMVNGLALHRGFKQFGATFLVFSDYARNAIRLAALMKIPSIFVFTHDSIGLGEDGPTHQPVEHLASLRLLPRLSVWRPCDAVETAVAWKLALESTAQPFALIFSRQTLAHQPRDEKQLALIEKGGYILRDCAGAPEVILIATGSEVELCVAVAEKLVNKRIRVVCIPSVDFFQQQDAAYRESVLPPKITARVVVEAGATRGWEGIAGADGMIVGVNDFGLSAPGDAVFAEFNITVEHVVKCAEELINRENSR